MQPADYTANMYNWLCVVRSEVIMIVRQAKEIARQWVVEQADTIPGFYGAFFHGSVNWLDEEALLPVASDVDVIVVLNRDNPANGPGKFRYRDLLLEVSYLPTSQFQSAEQILGQYALAGSFHRPGIILDPSGQLTELQTAVAKNYARRQWVVKRCDEARAKVVRYLDSINEADPFHEQVIRWVFATGVTTHVLLVAGLKNPTVRQRYPAVRALLDEYGHLDFYESLLALLGCGQMRKATAERHLVVLGEAFDVAKDHIKTSFSFHSDISDIGRSVAIDGSRALIDQGQHREAIFWMVVTFSRCHAVFYQDAPVGVFNQFDPPYRRLLSDLGLRSLADLQRRSEQVKQLLPRLWAVAEAIIAANPEIKD